jgi:hypothetical protein
MDSAQMELAPVAPVFDSLIHEQLLERRDKLKEAATIAGTEFEFAGLLNDVDAALAKFNNGHSASAKCARMRSSRNVCSPIR